MPVRNQAMTLQYTAWNTATNGAQTGDVANHTIRVVGDGVEFTPATAPTEIDATNAKGEYRQPLLATETNYDLVTVCGRSSTANVAIIPRSFPLLPASVGNLGQAQVNITSPIDSTGVLSIVIGKDYFAADGQQFDFTDTANKWPDLTSATVTLSVYDVNSGIAAPIIAVIGTILTPSGANKKVRFELAAATTALLAPANNYHYAVTAVLSSGHAPPPLTRGNVITSIP